MYTQATNWKKSHDVCLELSIDNDFTFLSVLFDTYMKAFNSLYAS